MTCKRNISSFRGEDVIIRRKSRIRLFQGSTLFCVQDHHFGHAALQPATSTSLTQDSYKKGFRE